MLEMFIHRQPWHPRQSATATRRFSSDEQKIWSVRRIQKYVDTFPHLSDATERLLPAVLILLMKLHHHQIHHPGVDENESDECVLLFSKHHDEGSRP